MKIDIGSFNVGGSVATLAAVIAYWLGRLNADHVLCVVAAWGVTVIVLHAIRRSA